MHAYAHLRWSVSMAHMFKHGTRVRAWHPSEEGHIKKGGQINKEGRIKEWGHIKEVGHIKAVLY